MVVGEFVHALKLLVAIAFAGADLMSRIRTLRIDFGYNASQAALAATTCAGSLSSSSAVPPAGRHRCPDVGTNAFDFSDSVRPAPSILASKCMMSPLPSSPGPRSTAPQARQPL